MAEEDAELVALLDNELDELAKGRLLARLAKRTRRWAGATRRCERPRQEFARIRSNRAAGNRRRFLAYARRFRRKAPLAQPPGNSPGSLSASLRRELSSAFWRRPRRGLRWALRRRGEQEDWRAAVEIRYAEGVHQRNLRFPEPRRVARSRATSAPWEPGWAQT